MGFNDFRGGFRVGAGFKPDGNSGFPLMETCDIQAGENGKRLDVVLTELKLLASSGGAGADGKTPYIGENGNWWIGDTDTGVKAGGSDGSGGSDGTDGSDGADGKTPYIGENGNWWIGDTDTGVKAGVVDSPLPIPIETETEMNALLVNATADSIGAIYKYTGPNTNTYTQGGLYIITSVLTDEETVSKVPTATKKNAGQVLTVDAEGTLVWRDVQAISNKRLKTRTKYIDSAINEINEKSIDEFVAGDNIALQIKESVDENNYTTRTLTISVEDSSGNGLPCVTVPNESITTVETIKNAVETAIGSYTNLCVVNLSGHSSNKLLVSFKHYGGNTYLFTLFDFESGKTISNAVDITTTTISDFLKMESTGVYQPKEDEKLETESKDVVGAINEVNKRTVNSIECYSDCFDDRDIYSVDEYGIWHGSTAYFTVSDSDQTFSTELRVPIVAGENINFEVDEKNAVVKINAKGGGSDNSNIRELIGSEGLKYDESKDGTYAICTGLGDCTDSDIKIASEYNGLPVEEIGLGAFSAADYDVSGITSITVPNSVKTIGHQFVEYCENLRSVFIPNSVTNIEDEAFIIKDAPTHIYFGATSQPDGWQTRWMGDLTKENITWGYNFPYDKNGNVEMPQIRFVGMPCSGWLGEVDWEQVTGEQRMETHNLKFTIEIVGGGALQVGDTIQICRMGTYGTYARNRKQYPPKKKLRRYFEYVITEEDLGKRFITFKVPYTDKKVIKLFTKWATSGVNDKSIYFRIRRPKDEINSGDNGGGMTVDAEFSNVVSVRCLSYAFVWYDSRLDEDVYFYQIRIT